MLNEVLASRASRNPALRLPVRRRMDAQVASKPNGSLIQPPPEAEAFYSQVLQLMAESDPLPRVGDVRA